MIDTSRIEVPPAVRVGFRHYRGEADHPGMLRVYAAAHEAEVSRR